MVGVTKRIFGRGGLSLRGRSRCESEGYKAPADQLPHDGTTGIQTNAGGGHQSAYLLPSAGSAH